MNNLVVTAAAGARDSYQVPIALHENNSLLYHVTDFYTPSLLCTPLRRLSRWFANTKIFDQLLRRSTPLLPSAKTRNCFKYILSDCLRKYLAPRSYWLGNHSLARSSLILAERHKAALLLYAGYALPAFKACTSNVPRKGLIQYHPHISTCLDIIKRDAIEFPSLSPAFHDLLRDAIDHSNTPELLLADLVLCCSTFSAKSCMAEGIPSDKIVTIPYGVNFHQARPKLLSDKIRFLFVGSGITRKGLHRLLLSWKRANLSRSELTVVSRHIDPNILDLVSPLPGNVCLVQNASSADLVNFYHRSNIFVMPSLVEGFGYVYLEALSHGCFCIGTPNTGLPDLLVNMPYAGFIVDPFVPAELDDCLAYAEQQALQGLIDYEKISLATHEHWPWKRFRQRLVSALEESLF
jgi:glycosyltransferase involved in cell wall biosynthesis